MIKTILQNFLFQKLDGHRFIVFAIWTRCCIMVYFYVYFDGRSGKLTSMDEVN